MKTQEITDLRSDAVIALRNQKLEEYLFEPNWASCPSNTVRRRIKAKNLTLSSFAFKMGYVESLAQRIMEGEARISTHVAERLSVVLGGTPNFWISRQRQYDEGFQRINAQ